MRHPFVEQFHQLGQLDLGLLSAKLRHVYNDSNNCFYRSANPGLRNDAILMKFHARRIEGILYLTNLKPWLRKTVGPSVGNTLQESCKDLPFDAGVPTPQDIPSFCKRISLVTATLRGARGTLGVSS